jgi:hypothetical protein
MMVLVTMRPRPSRQVRQTRSEDHVLGLMKQRNFKLNVPGLRSSPHIMRTLSISPVRGPMAGKAIGSLDRSRSRLY